MHETRIFMAKEQADAVPNASVDISEDWVSVKRCEHHCGAMAPLAMVRNAVATARTGNHRNEGKVWSRGDEGSSTMTSSIASASAVET